MAERQRTRSGKRMDFSEQLLELLGRLKALAGEYYELTGQALVGVADEIAEYEAAARGRAPRACKSRRRDSQRESGDLDRADVSDVPPRLTPGLEMPGISTSDTCYFRYVTISERPFQLPFARRRRLRSTANSSVQIVRRRDLRGWLWEPGSEH